jgi:2-methylcitrate dehydratase PrpD
MTEGITDRLVAYVVAAGRQPLPDEIVLSTKHHVLDTVASVVSGGGLAPGRAGLRYARARSDSGPATLVADGGGASIEMAALANAMAGHADETDDTHELSKSHPGASIVSTAVAVAEAEGRSGELLLRAVALGYDVGPRVNMSLWTDFAEVRKQRRGTPTISGMFGSAAAIASLRELDATRVRYLLSYVAQQVSGMNTWKRDLEHIEKAWVIAGWPAYGALLAASLVEAGWTGVSDVFEGDPSFLDIVGGSPDSAQLVEGLGSRFEVARTHLKVHSVGSPAQAPIQALTGLLRGHDLRDADIASVEVTLPAVLAHTVQSSRRMGNINLAYLLSVTLADGALSFAAAHDDERFEAWTAAGEDPRITVVPDPELAPRRQAAVRLMTVDGREHVCRVDPVRGSPENPMTTDDVVAKSADLMTPLVGSQRAAEIADAVLNVDTDGGLPRLTGLMRRVDRMDTMAKSVRIAHNDALREQDPSGDESEGPW